MPFSPAILVLALATAPAPLTLDESMALALAHHPAAMQADADLAIARQKAKAAGLALWPELDLQSGALYTSPSGGQPSFIANNTIMETRAQVVARVPIDTGQLGAARRQAELDATSAVYAARSAKATLALSVGQAYFDELRAEHAIEAYGAAHDGAEAQRKATLAQLKSGRVARLDLRRAEAALASIDASLLGAHADLDVARRRFTELTGATPGFRLAEPPPPPPVPTSAVAQRVSMSDAEARPEVREARADAAARLAERDAAWLARRPQVNVTAMGGWDTGGAMSGSNLGASYGVDLSWPLFDGGRLATAARSADLGARRAAAALAAAQLAARADLEDARAALSKAQGQYYAQLRARQVADEALAMARIGFGEGAVSGLDLIIAQQAAVSARIAQQNALYDYHAAALKLRWATGAIVPSEELPHAP